MASPFPCPLCGTQVTMPPRSNRGVTCPGCGVGLPRDAASAANNQGPLYRKGGLGSGRSDHKVRYGWERKAALAWAGLALSLALTGCATTPEWERELWANPYVTLEGKKEIVREWKARPQGGGWVGPVALTCWSWHGRYDAYTRCY